MRIFLLSSLLVLLALIGFACSGAQSSAGPSPTETYKALFAAVKSKNTDAIKQQMSKNTLDFANSVAQRQNTPIEKVFENGFTATTFSEKLPEMRDERISDNFGALEVWNSKESKWEDLPFVKEETGWKLAVGDLFKGSWKSPGKGRAAKEMEAANAANGGLQALPMSNANTNGNFGAGKMGNSNANAGTVRPIVPKPAANANAPK
jgi:hypothetical protein